MPYTAPNGNVVAIPFANPYTPPNGNVVPIPFADTLPFPAPIADTYGVAFNETLTVDAPGFLSNDVLNGATVSLVTSTSYGALTFFVDGAFVYVPNTGFAGSDSFVYRLTNTWGEFETTVTLVVSAPPPVVRYEHAIARLPWSRAPQRARAIGTPYRTAARVRGAPRLAWDAAPSIQRARTIAWSIAARVRIQARLPWGQAPVQTPRSLGVPWRHVPRREVTAALPWGRPPSRAMTAALPWTAPPGRRVSVFLPWTVPPARRRLPDLPWRSPPLRDRRWWLPWRHARALQWTVHSPGVQPPTEPPPPHYEPPAGNHVAVAFACPQLAFDGRNVPVPFGPAACYFAWPKPKVYIVENSASVVRLPERSPISVTSIDLTQTIDDVHWSVRMSLGDPADLDLLKADEDGPKVVEITINGYVWTAIIESYKQDRRHPTRLVDVAGRSQTALLDAPYAPLRTKVETADKLAQQLVDAELELTDFTADYDTVSWLVPGGVWHYDGTTAITAVKTVAAASGAIALAHPWDKIVRIAPRYPASPWAWSTTAADKFVQDDIILQDTLQLVSKPLYDYVLVSGDQVGVADPILRDGSAGTIRAPMVIDALITDHAASLERGRNVLCDRGEQAKVDNTIPLFPADVAGQPGLILPLDIVEVVEPTSWKALAIGVSISAGMQQAPNGRAVLVVEQTVTLERHYTDAG